MEFVIRDDSEGNPEIISHSILSDMVSTSVDKAEKASSQWHHASADQKKLLKIVSEYDQEITQSQTADKPVPS